MSALHANAAVAVAVLLCGVSLLLALVGLLTWRRLGHAKIAWVSLAFLLFAGEGAYFTLDAVGRRAELAAGWDALPWLSLVNLAIVLCLYLAVLKR